MSFRINSPSVIHETIDDEVVIINLDKGHYYSLDGCGSDVWLGLVGGAAPATIAATFDGDGAEIERAVGELVAELEAEGLIVAAAGGDTAPAQPLESGKPFDAPRLQRYSDMEELLLIDPIHEVDAQGWPHPDPAA